ncbi:hypothetical protein [Desulfurivibrio dismutans]|uniref:hypothetical protein n=1 Tax=Desulfurivibrio dismutans TaxID=1398908 RepID=UPI0023DA23AA|nr:hypothetical protein [Desulfurivibrio alkaliphilus]MDF1613654.1 hypothetical protein [Desulfurivibrio alkaliphilus]
MAAQRHAATAWEALDGVRRHKDPKSTAAAHLGRVEALTTKTLNTVVSRARSAFDRLKLREGELNRKISEQLLTPTQDAGEIRAVLRAMNPADRSAAVSRAIQEGDSAVVSAVLGGQPLTVSFEARELAAFRKMAENKMTPDLVAQRAEIQRAKKLTADVLDSSVEISIEAQGSPAARKQFQEDSHRASEAEQKLAGIVNRTDMTGGWDSLQQG